MPDGSPLSSTTSDGPTGLGGWLVLIAIGLIATPFKLGFFVMNTILPVFEGDTWSALTVPGSESYHPLWGPLLTFELVGNCAFIVFAAALLFPFFGKRASFPKLIIIFWITNLLFVAGDAMLGNLIPFVAAQDDPTTRMEIMKTVIASAIWIPYFRISKRVKNTFVN
jgi:uncharacterized protein DUF2569